jgi:hypothetical protein
LFFVVKITCFEKETDMRTGYELFSNAEFDGRVFAWTDNEYRPYGSHHVLLQYEWFGVNPATVLREKKSAQLELRICIRPEETVDGYAIYRGSGHGDQRSAPYIVAKSARGAEDAIKDLMSGPPTVEIRGRTGQNGNPAIHGLTLPERPSAHVVR